MNFVINGDQVVDVRVESVPGAIIVRVINPNIPRLPFRGDGDAALEFADGVVGAAPGIVSAAAGAAALEFADGIIGAAALEFADGVVGTAALEFADGVVGAAPGGLKRAASGARAVGDILTWGAPQGEGALVRYSGSSLEAWMSSEFGGMDLTNADVVFLSLAVGIGGAYASSYAYYLSLREEAEREAGEKKAKAAAGAAASKKKKKEEEAATMAKKVRGADGDGGDGTDPKGATEAVEMKGSVSATTTTVSAEIAAESAEAQNAKAGREAGTVANANARGGDGGVVVGESADVEDNSKVGDDEVPTPRPRRRDAIMKNLFGRRKK
jgi:hypothetical protein